MKTHPRIHISKATLGGVLLLACSVAPATPVQETATAPAEPATTHTMFMGLDLSVPYQDKTLPILDVSDDSMIVSSDAKLVRVPTGGRNFRLHVKHALKLSDSDATIGELSAEPGYSPDKDPHRKFANAAGGAGSVGAMVDLASVGMRGGEMVLAAVTGVATAGGGSPESTAGTPAAQQIDQATNAMVTASQSAFSDQFQTDTYVQKLNEELAEGNFDAFDVEFRVSSSKPLNAPWIAVLIKYRDRDRPQADVQTWIVTKALAPIGPEARKVRFKQTGLPVGFRMESYQVHLYNNGEEIATSESPMRTNLAPEEAFQFRVIDYVMIHADATLPASPAAGQLTEPLRTHLSTRYLNRPVYVKVLPTGHAERAYSDNTCKQAIDDPELASMLATVRFNPALDKGKPIRGVVMLVGKSG